MTIRGQKAGVNLVKFLRKQDKINKQRGNIFPIYQKVWEKNLKNLSEHAPVLGSSEYLPLMVSSSIIQPKKAIPNAWSITYFGNLVLGTILRSYQS